MGVLVNKSTPAVVAAPVKAPFTIGLVIPTLVNAFVMGFMLVPLNIDVLGATAPVSVAPAVPLNAPT